MDRDDKCSIRGSPAVPGFLQIPSHLDGFVQADAPKEDVRTEEFRTRRIEL